MFDRGYFWSVSSPHVEGTETLFVLGLSLMFFFSGKEERTLQPHQILYHNDKFSRDFLLEVFLKILNSNYELSNFRFLAFNNSTLEVSLFLKVIN